MTTVVNVRTFGKKKFSFQVGTIVNGELTVVKQSLVLDGNNPDAVIGEWIRFNVPAFNRMQKTDVLSRYAFANDIPLLVNRTKMRTARELKFS